MTNAEARFSNSLRPRKPEGSLGRTAQDGHLDSHTTPELLGSRIADFIVFIVCRPGGLRVGRCRVWQSVVRGGPAPDEGRCCKRQEASVGKLVACSLREALRVSLKSAELRDATSRFRAVGCPTVTLQ